jgi:hypothetical protein
MVHYSITVDPEATYVFDQEYHAENSTTHGEPMMTLADLIAFNDANTRATVPKGMFWDIDDHGYHDEDSAAIGFNGDAQLRYEVRVQTPSVQLSWLVNQPPVTAISALPLPPMPPPRNAVQPQRQHARQGRFTKQDINWIINF